MDLNNQESINKKVTILSLISNVKDLKVRLTDNFCTYLKSNIQITELSKELGISELFLKRKIKDNDEYSFTLSEILTIASKLALNQENVFASITHAKIKYGYWYEIPKIINLDEGFVEGVAYYIGDGRSKTDGGLSTVNCDVKIIRFFIAWLKDYFNVKHSDLKIHVRINSLSFDEELIKVEWSEKLGLNPNYISSVNKKHGGKFHHKVLCEVLVNRGILKLIFDLLIPIVKDASLKDKKLAAAYIRGIMAAEGSPHYYKANARTNGSRGVTLKMKPKKEIDYVHSLLNELGINSTIRYSKSDNEWIIYISGVYELEKLAKIGVFELTSNRNDRFQSLISSYRRKQTKVGGVNEYYLTKLMQFKKNCEEVTAPKLAKFVGRDRTRTIYVLRKLQKEGLIEGKRIRRTGTPFMFDVTEKGIKLLNDFSK